jgi:hypothetical protein
MSSSNLVISSIRRVIAEFEVLFVGSLRPIYRIAVGRGVASMTFCRMALVAVGLILVPLQVAYAQFGGMPGLPGSPGMPGYPGTPGSTQMPASPGFGAPQGPPPGCQQLLAQRDETAKHGQALQAAGKKKAAPPETCKLFKAFLAAEAKFVKGLEENSAACGVPSDIIKQIKLAHGKASEVGKSVCEAAAQGPRPAGPTLSDALGTTPVVPDASAAKRGQGTFDTLMGSPLAQ